MVAAKVKRQGTMIVQGSMKDSSSSTGRRRGSLIARIGSRRFRSDTSQRLLDDSGDPAPIDDVIMLSEEDILLVEDRTSGVPLAAKPNSVHELARIRTKTECILEETKPSLEQAEPDSPSNERSSRRHETKRRGQSWRKVSIIGLPRLGSRRRRVECASVHSEPSDNEETLQDESSHSSEDDQILAANEESMQTSCHSITILTRDAVNQQPDQTDSIAAIEGSTAVPMEETKNLEAVTSTRESCDDCPLKPDEEPTVELEGGAVSVEDTIVPKSVTSNEACTDSGLAKESHRSSSQSNEVVHGTQTLFSPSLDEFTGQEGDVNLENEPSSPTSSSFMESFPNPFEMFRSSDTKEQENAFAPTLDGFQSTKAENLSIKKASTTNETGMERIVITTVESKDTAASGTDSIWDNVWETTEKIPLQTEDEWTMFATRNDLTTGKVFDDSFLPMESRQCNTVPPAENDQDVPSDEDQQTSHACIASGSRGTPIVWTGNSFGEPIAEARLVLQDNRNATRVMRPAAVEGTTERPQRMACTRIILQLDNLKDGCSGLFNACATAAVESCCLLVVIGEGITEEIAHCCLGGENEEDSRRGPPEQRKSRRSKRTRTAKPTTEVSFKKTSTQAQDSDEDFSNVRSRRRSPFSKARVAPASQANKVHDSRYYGDRDSRYKDFNYTSHSEVGRTEPKMISPGVVVVGSTSVDWSPKYEDKALLEDVDRFMTAMRPIKECQQQVRELRSDRSRTMEEIEKEAWFWRQHEAKWKTRLPFHGGEITHDSDTHFE